MKRIGEGRAANAFATLLSRLEGEGTRLRVYRRMSWRNSVVKQQIPCGDDREKNKGNRLRLVDGAVAGDDEALYAGAVEGDGAEALLVLRDVVGEDVQQC